MPLTCAYKIAFKTEYTLPFLLFFKTLHHMWGMYRLVKYFSPKWVASIKSSHWHEHEKIIYFHLLINFLLIVYYKYTVELSLQTTVVCERSSWHKDVVFVIGIFLITVNHCLTYNKYWCSFSVKLWIILIYLHVGCLLTTHFCHHAFWHAVFWWE